MRITIDVPEGYIVQVIPEDKSSRAVTADWINENRDKFKGIDIEREWAKAKAWCAANRRQCTRQFFVKWLNRVDPEFYSSVAKAAILEDGKAIKAKYPVDAMGQLVGITPEDAARLKKLRADYKKL